MQTLDVLAEWLSWRGITFSRMDGSTNPIQRELDVRDFNADGSPTKVFLISTRAGGVGITLASADVGEAQIQSRLGGRWGGADSTSPRRTGFNCRYGECVDGGGGCSVTPGTLVTLASVRCEVPAAPITFGPDEQSRSISLALAPNGAQYTHHGANFTYLALEPLVLALEPPIGALRGVTHVTVRGSGLALGTARRCRFVLSPSTRVEVSASALLDGNGVVCVWPHRLRALSPPPSRSP